MISPAHPLLPVATECLKYDQEDRPSAQQLCEQLATLKEAPHCPQYSESKQRVQESSSPVGNDTTDKDRTIRELHQQVQEKGHVIQEKDHVIQQKDHVIQGNAQVIQEKDHVISEKVRMLRDSNRQLEDNEQVVAEFQQTLAQREKENRDLRESLSARDSDINDLQRQLQHLRVEQPQAKVGSMMAEKRSMKLRWRDGGKAPEKIVFGSCAADGHMAYFRNANTDNVHAYNAAIYWELEQTAKLPI